MLRLAAQNPDQQVVRYAHMDATNLWFPDDAFDAVICTWALHLMTDPDAVIGELARVLHPSGRVVVVTLTLGGVLTPWPIREAVTRILGITPFDPVDLSARLANHGLQPIVMDRWGAGLFRCAECTA